MKKNPAKPTTYTGPTAPLTSLALSPDSATLLAGCWDKTVWSWNVRTRAPAHRYAGHADFVKCIATTSIRSADGTATPILITGSADTTLGIWDLASGQKLHSIRGHSRAVLDVAVAPRQPDEDAGAFVLWSAGSDRSILRHRVALDGVALQPFPAAATAQAGVEEVEDALTLHETSVNGLAFTVQPDTGGVTLLTASSDKSAKRSVATANGEWRPEATMPHPDFVRAVVPLEGGALVATACRDEEVRVFDGEDEGEAEALFVLSGHFDEVSGLCVARVHGEEVLVSVGLDGTVRRWPATRGALEGMVARAREAARKEDAGEEVVGEEKGSMLTAEEEAELAELMEDD